VRHTKPHHRHLRASYSPQRRHVGPSIRPIGRSQASECSRTLCRPIPPEQPLADYVQTASRNMASRSEISFAGGGTHAAPEQRYCVIAVGRRSPTKQHWKKGIDKHISITIAMMPTIRLGKHDAHHANQLLGNPSLGLSAPYAAANAD
jgi:hypothetical protein